MRPGLVFVTSSPHKHREAEAILGVPLARVSLDLPEWQGLDLVALAKEKAREAFARLRQAVLVEDTSLELAALGGFPGPLVKWLLQAAGPGAIPRMLSGFGDFRATARTAAVVFDGATYQLGVGEVPGLIVERPRGSNGFGWDVVFAPEGGGGRTYAEMPPEEKNRCSHRAKAFLALRQALQAHPTSFGQR